MDENGHFMLIANEADYVKDRYDHQVISKHSKMTQVILSRNSRQIKEFAFEKQSLESEENYLGDGFFPREGEFFKLK